MRIRNALHDTISKYRAGFSLTAKCYTISTSTEAWDAKGKRAEEGCLGHFANDRAVMEAYGFWGRLNTEPECVAALMSLYQQLTAK